MKRVSILSIAAVLFFASCTNNNSPSVGSYEREEEVSESKEEENKHGAASHGGHEGAGAEHGTVEGTELSDTTSVLNMHRDSLDK